MKGVNEIASRVDAVGRFPICINLVVISALSKTACEVDADKAVDFLEERLTAIDR